MNCCNTMLRSMPVCYVSVYSSHFPAAGEHAQSLELMDEYISIARTAEQPFSDTNVDHFISVFNSIVEALESASGEISGPLDRESVLSKTFKIMEKAIELSKSPKLYLCLGKYHMDRHQLSQAQKYLAHAQDVELLFSVVSTWAAHVQEHEKPMVYLRCVLIQLASGDFSGAKCLLLMLNADFENPDEVGGILTRMTLFSSLYRFKWHTSSLRCVINRITSSSSSYARHTSRSLTQIPSSRDSYTT